MTQQVLAAKVEAINSCHKRANELYEELVPIFRPLIGQKMFKNDGSLLAKVEKLLPPMPYGSALQVFFVKGFNRVAFCVKTCVSYDSCSCVYHDVVVYVGFTNEDGILKEIADKDDRKADWTVDGIVNQRAKVKSLKDQYEAEKGLLGSFGE
jgi:hypothetical protein